MEQELNSIITGLNQRQNQIMDYIVSRDYIEVGHDSLVASGRYCMMYVLMSMSDYADEISKDSPEDGQFIFTVVSRMLKNIKGDFDRSSFDVDKQALSYAMFSVRIQPRSGRLVSNSDSFDGMLKDLGKLEHEEVYLVQKRDSSITPLAPATVASLISRRDVELEA